MKLLAKLLVASALFFSCAVVFADGYLLGQGPDTSNGFNEEALNALATKYHIPFHVSPSSFSNNHYYDVGGYELRHGVFMLQSSLENGDRTDLIFKSQQAAIKFEEELLATSRAHNFYVQPVIGVQNQKVIAVAYEEAQNNDTVRIKHYFIANEWGWKPGDFE